MNLTLKEISYVNQGDFLKMLQTEPTEWCSKASMIKEWSNGAVYTTNQIKEMLQPRFPGLVYDAHTADNLDKVTFKELIEGPKDIVLYVSAAYLCGPLDEKRRLFFSRLYHAVIPADLL